jgi:hypothetical protein
VGGPPPQRHGLSGWTYDPVMVSTGTQVTNGTFYVAYVHNAVAVKLTRFCYHITVAATGEVTNQNQIALFNLAGTKISQSLAIHGTWVNTIGLKNATGMTAIDLARDTGYWLGFVFNATTPPTIGRATGTASASSLINVNLGAAASRFGVAGTGLTELPASFTPSSITTTNAISIWGAIG